MHEQQTVIAHSLWHKKKIPTNRSQRTWKPETNEPASVTAKTGPLNDKVERFQRPVKHQLGEFYFFTGPLPTLTSVQKDEWGTTFRSSSENTYFNLQVFNLLNLLLRKKQMPPEIVQAASELRRRWLLLQTCNGRSFFCLRNHTFYRRKQNSHLVWQFTPVYARIAVENCVLSNWIKIHQIPRKPTTMLSTYQHHLL